MPKDKLPKQAHTPMTQRGVGDYYGTGIKQKVGKMRDSYMVDSMPMSPKKMKTSPKSLA